MVVLCPTGRLGGFALFRRACRPIRKGGRSMPTRASGLCAYPGCKARVASGKYCSLHMPTGRRGGKPEDRTNTPWHKLYYRRDWQKLRAAHLMREPFCRECAKEGRITVATDVDHIQPHRGDMGLFLDDGNLQSLCHGCHSRKTRREMDTRAAEKQGAGG